MEIIVYSLLWVMQDLYHQPYTHEKIELLTEPDVQYHGWSTQLSSMGGIKDWNRVLGYTAPLIPGTLPNSIANYSGLYILVGHVSF